MASVVNQAATAVQGMVTAPLAEGSKLPSTLLKADNPQSASVDLSTLKGKNLVAGVPGAFSPACSSQVPGYVEQAQKFADKGIQGIYIIAVNDVFVVQAWREKLNAKDSKLLHFLSDDAGAWTAAAGMAVETTAVMGNRRSRRFAAVVEDGVVTKVWKEDEVPAVTVTSADNVLQSI